jgi:hypothetical protein
VVVVVVVVAGLSDEAHELRIIPKSGRAKPKSSFFMSGN